VGAHNHWRGKLVKSLHDSSLGGHFGILGTYQRVKRLFTWPKLKEGVIQHVQNYDICQLNKGELVPVPGLL
jgi:Integrase zinc binding domain